MSVFRNVKVMNVTGYILKQKEYDMFCWGRVVAIHKIGTSEIIEYIPTMNGSRELACTNYFHINGHNQSVLTLDSAIVCALAFKYDGGDSRAGHYICRMLGIQEET